MLAVLGGGADLVVDCVCHTAAQAATLLPLVSSVTSTVMIWGKAVYIDANVRKRAACADISMQGHTNVAYGRRVSE